MTEVMHRSQILTFSTCVAAALFVGATTLMPAGVYSTAWWFIFWACVALAIIAAIICGHLLRRPAAFMMHLSFVLILAGGGATALTAQRGTLHLAPGEKSSHFINDKGVPAPLPAEVTLKSFTTDYYPGMTFPRDFRSVLTVGDGAVIEISMNRIGRLKGYRLYQTSFDRTGGTILSVYHDPVGIPLTYAGYMLFALSGAAMLLRKFRKTLACAAVALAILSPVCAKASLPAVSAEFADSLAPRPVTFNGRVVPFETFARELTLKLTGHPDAGGLRATRFTASLISWPDSWRTVPFIRVKNGHLRKALGMEGEYISPSELYSSDNQYIPAALYHGGEGALDKDILQLDEKVALLGQLWSGTLFMPIEPGDLRYPSHTEIRMQLWFDRVDVPKLLFILVFSCAVAVMFGAPRRLTTLVAATAGLCVFIWQWLILGHIPLADSPQILRFMSAGILLTSVFVSTKDRLLSCLALVMAGCLALVSWMGTRNPAMTPLMPVLSSPWLAIHVSLVMTSYAILGFTLPVALTALLLPSRRTSLAHLTSDILMPGTYILGLGIFTGAMWANVSWGRYWAWDPKETWALVTLLLYAIPLHRGVGLRAHPLFFHIYIALASLSILMTYAGVNMLDSLHAYA